MYVVISTTVFNRLEFVRINNMMKIRLFYSVLLLLVVLQASSQDLRINLYTTGSGLEKQLVAVLTNTTDRLIRVRNYEGAADGSCLYMNFQDQDKKVLYNNVHIFVNPNEYKRWLDIKPKENVTFKYSLGRIRESYKKASEIKSVEVFCILIYATSNTSFPYNYERTFTFFF